MYLKTIFGQINPDSCSLHGGRLFSVSGNSHSPPWHVDAVLGRGDHPITSTIFSLRLVLNIVPRLPLKLRGAKCLDLQGANLARQLIVEQRTALANQLRALLAEYGVIIPAGLQRLQQQLPEVLEDGDNTITFTLRRLLSLLREDMQMLTERIDVLDKELAELSSQPVAYHHLLTIPGVGPLIAAAVVSEVDATQFSSGRELSAWCGLVPRQHSSGGKQRLSSMTKNGNRNLRTLIIHGARAVMRCVQKRDDSLGRWVKAIELRRGFLKATVALANKLTRIIWRVLTDSVDFSMNRAFAGS